MRATTSYLSLLRKTALKVLLSAFACEPNSGSENAVGWNWALRLAEAGHDVTALTRASSRKAVARELAQLPTKARLRFVYQDVPAMLRSENRGALHLHHLLWQWTAAHFAGRLHETEKFERVHHVTYAGVRAPSFMGRLGIPFIFGPVGGGERAPWRLRSGYGLVTAALEMARDAANLIVRLSPMMRSTFEHASQIYVTSPGTP